MDVMGPLAVLSALIGLSVLWAFLYFPPAYAEKKQVRVFNMMAFGLATMFILVYILNIAVFISGPQLATYRTFFITIGSFGIESAVLIVFFVLRNFWIFKPRKFGRF